MRSQGNLRMSDSPSILLLSPLTKSTHTISRFSRLSMSWIQFLKHFWTCMISKLCLWPVLGAKPLSWVEARGHCWHITYYHPWWNKQTIWTFTHRIIFPVALKSSVGLSQNYGSCSFNDQHVPQSLCLNSPLSLPFSMAAIYYLPEVDRGRVLLSADETPSSVNF